MADPCTNDSTNGYEEVTLKTSITVGAIISVVPILVFGLYLHEHKPLCFLTQAVLCIYVPPPMSEKSNLAHRYMSKAVTHSSRLAAENEAVTHVLWRAVGPL